ncbi:MAG TPA: DoxX family protein [Solirubrobacteraceae bacterium]|nr:DoxX family protein [Solirubrobacteraceae bacterium]
MARDRVLLLLRLLAGGVLVVFGIGKFVNHTSELASFKSYGLPAPEAFVVVIGLIELVGGLLLMTGVLTRPAAVVLAGDMIGAIVVSGIANGELVSVTLAPAELVAMLVLLWTGPGGYAIRPSPSVSVLPRSTMELLR